MNEYSEFNDFNRYSNIGGIEGNIISHLVYSNTKSMDDFWKLLKYPEKDVLARPDRYPTVVVSERWKMVSGMNNDGTPEDRVKIVRVIPAPFLNDAFKEECSLVCIYVENIYPQTHLGATISLAIETLTHVNINTIMTNAQDNPNTHPNDYRQQDDGNVQLVSYIKSRETLLVQALLSELNGIDIDGIGYMHFSTDEGVDTDGNGGNIRGKADLKLFKGSFFGHKLIFNVKMSGVASDNNYFDNKLSDDELYGRNK